MPWDIPWAAAFTSTPPKVLEKAVATPLAMNFRKYNYFLKQKLQLFRVVACFVCSRLWSRASPEASGRASR